MKLFLQSLLTFSVVLCGSQSASAAIKIFGEVQVFRGFGNYSAKIFAQAVDQAEEIGGFNLVVDVSDSQVAFNSLVYAEAFETGLPNAPGSDPLLLQGTDTGFNGGLVLEDGEIGTLATLTFTVSGPGDVSFLTQGLSVNTPFFSPIPATVTGPISFQMVPEPSSTALCAVGVLGMVARRRRR